MRNDRRVPKPASEGSYPADRIRRSSFPRARNEIRARPDAADFVGLDAEIAQRGVIQPRYLATLEVLGHC